MYYSFINTVQDFSNNEQILSRIYLWQFSLTMTPPTEWYHCNLSTGIYDCEYYAWSTDCYCYCGIQAEFEKRWVGDKWSGMLVFKHYPSSLLTAFYIPVGHKISVFYDAKYIGTCQGRIFSYNNSLEELLEESRTLPENSENSPRYKYICHIEYERVVFFSTSFTIKYLA